MERSAALRQKVDAWTLDDPDPNTREELKKLVQVGDEEELTDRFSGQLKFGTAGLRGLIGGGPNRMNRKVVIRATAGLCAYLLEKVEGAQERGIAIGYDGRHMSVEFAEDAASVALGMGFHVHRFTHVVPTPQLAFACLDVNAAAGIMVTASHNPPAYNGYKVYWENGAQIIPPHDGGIAACIDAVGPLDQLPQASQEERAARTHILGEAVERRYLDGVRALQVHPGLPRDLKIAYTALHGVGDRLARIALSEAGFTHVHSVAEQAEPDGDFPTVAFPNPEEDGAMDLVLALAKRENVDLVMANDPDADRLAVAVPDGEGGFTALTGNDVGCLLGHYLLDQGPAGSARLVVNSIVSSPMLGAIAQAHNAHFEATLTGFKWIANRAMALEAKGARFVFGYEEALGYTISDLVRDKDGIGAAVVFADLAAWCQSQGRSLLTELERTWRRYGMYQSRQVSIVLPGEEGAAQIAAIMDRVRQATPKALGEHAVLAVQDLQTGTRTTPEGRATSLSFPKSNVLAFELEGGHRVMLRPSGTEPKIKFYFDVCIAIGDDEAIDAARQRSETLLHQLVNALKALAEV